MSTSRPSSFFTSSLPSMLRVLSGDRGVESLSEDSNTIDSSLGDDIWCIGFLSSASLALFLLCCKVSEDDMTGRNGYERSLRERGLPSVDSDRFLSSVFFSFFDSFDLDGFKSLQQMSLGLDELLFISDAQV